MYGENYKMMKEIKDNLNKWKDILCSWIGELKVGKMSNFPKLFYKLNTIPIKVPADYFQ